jgi:TusA-related sulfurtransferase
MNADKRLDLRQAVMPLSLLEFKSSLKELAQGMVIEVLIGDEESFEDLKKIIDRSQDRIISVKMTGNGFYQIFIEKGGENGKFL